MKTTNDRIKETKEKIDKLDNWLDDCGYHSMVVEHKDDLENELQWLESLKEKITRKFVADTCDDVPQWIFNELLGEELKR